MDIYTTPYFYIIQHIESKKLYAGSKWAIGCHPDEFMQPKGYQTSSNLINSIIEQEGLSAFSILRIDTYCDDIHPYDYESSFLRCLDCAKSPDWYNGHNNNGVPWGTEEYKEKLLENYGVENVFQLESVKVKSKKTNLKKYGVEYASQSKEIKDKTISTCLENWGVEYALQSQDVRDKSTKTVLAKYGVENVSKSQEIKDKKISTCLGNWGVEHHFQSQDIKDSIKESCLLSLGVEYPMQSQEVRDKSKKSINSQYGVENISQYMFFSIIENKKTYAKNIISRLYPEMKKYY